MPRTFRRFVAFDKVDEELREVYGYATVEEIDKQGEIVKFDGACRAFERQADYFERVTAGDSKGNVRVMHTNVAAGKVIAWDADHTKKAIPIGTKIVDDDAFNKCREKVYIGFSISGIPTKEHKEKHNGKTVNVIDEFDLLEVSLVDHPACPSATINLIKFADGKRVEGQVPGESPEDAALRKEAAEKAARNSMLGDASTPAPTPTPTPEPVPAAKAAKAESEPTTVRTLIFSADKYDVAAAKKWASEHGYRASRVADPGDGKSVRLPQRDAGDFKEESVKTVEIKDGVQAEIGVLKLATSRFGKILKAALGAGFRKQGSESFSIFPALAALREIQSAMDSESFELQFGEGDPEAEKADIRFLYEAVTALLDFLGSEFEQEVLSWTSGDGAAMKQAGAAFEWATTLSKALSPFQLRKLLDDEEMKANLDAVHRMGHGLVKASAAMGSDCPDGECESDGDEGDEGDEKKEKPGDGAVPPAEKDEKLAGAKPAGKAIALPAEIAGVESRSIAKIVRAIEQVGEQVGAVKASVASLDERVNKIAALPAAIGRSPAVVREKEIGGVQIVNAADEVSVLRKHADRQTDPAVKQAFHMAAAVAAAEKLPTVGS